MYFLAVLMEKLKLNYLMKNNNGEQIVLQEKILKKMKIILKNLLTND